MDIDPDISKWVLEFLLRQQSLEDRPLNALLEILPISNNNQNLQKLLLLKKLESQASSSSISEHTLEYLEQIEEIEFQRGVQKVPDSMKRAYCAVAVESTVKQLEDDCNSGRFRFFEAVKRVWKGRMERMVKVVGNGRLASDDLLRWKNELEDAVWEDDACESVVRRCNEEINAVDAVSAYVREERERMGPSFLELVAAKVKNDEHVKGGFGVDEVRGGVYCRVEVDKEMHKDDIQPIKKSNGMKHSRRLTARSRVVRIFDPNDKIIDPSEANDISPHKWEGNRVREALESSSLNFQAVIRDPLPDALQHAEVTCSIARKNESHDPVEKNNCVETNVLTMDCGGVTQGSRFDMNNPPRPSMEHCDSDSHESDDSINTSSETSGNCRDMILVASPTLLNVSPLNIYDSRNQKKRRKARRWSTVEEDTLRTGVQRYGQGNWKMILNAYRDIFLYRTEVDLKDKWRNLTRG